MGDDVALFAQRAGILLRMADKAEAEGRFEDAEVHFNRGQEYLMKSRRAAKLDYANKNGMAIALLIIAAVVLIALAAA